MSTYSRTPHVFGPTRDSNQEDIDAAKTSNKIVNDPGTNKHLGSTAELVASYDPGDYYLLTETGGRVTLYRVANRGKLDMGGPATGNNTGSMGTTTGDAARYMNDANRKLWQRGPRTGVSV